MELTKEQLLQIDNYIFACGIKYYDVRTEIVDHFANVLEAKLEENPDLNFKGEIEKIHRSFSDRGFSNLLKEKTKSVQKKFYRQSLKHLITFFKLPKIIFTAVIFYILFLLMNLFDNKENYFQVLTGLGFIIVFIFGILNKKKKKQLFLALNMNNSLFQFAINSIVCFNSVTIFRTSESFINPIFNNIQLALYVLVLLFFWSCKSVFFQNKKSVKKQYPNIIV